MNIYGDSGNRWYVGYNTAQSLFSAGLNSPSGYESMPAGNAHDDALFLAAARQTAALAMPYPAGKGPVISVEGVHWANVNGPYPSQAAANVEVQHLQSIAPAPGFLQQVQNQAKTTVGAVANASGLTSFLGALTNSNLWIRVVKIVVGGAMLLLGMAKLTGMGQAAGSVIGKAVKVAPLL